MGTPHVSERASRARGNTYRVKFIYVEPEYARERGIDVVPYTGVFDVNALDPEEGIMIATELFHAAQRRSGVSWAREIQTVSWRVLNEG